MGPDQEFAGVGAVGPDQRDPLVPVAQARQRALGTVAVLDAGGGDDNDQQQTQGIHDDVPLGALHFLAASYPREMVATVSAARSDCESMIPAPGSSSTQHVRFA